PRRRRAPSRLPSTPEREVERRAVIDLAFGTDLTVVSPHDTLDRGQTDPGTLELAWRVEALERAKELIGVGHVEARSVVPDEVGRLALAFLPAEGDLRLLALG